MSFTPGERSDHDNNILENKNFQEIKEVTENYESTFDNNNNTKNSKDDKKIPIQNNFIENEKEEKFEKKEKEQVLNLRNGKSNRELNNNNDENISEDKEEHKEKEIENKIRNKNIDNLEIKEKGNDNNVENKEENKNMKNREYIIMDNTFNEVERFNAKKILRGDLAEIYEELINSNIDFKDDIFFVNLNHFEKRVGDCDGKIISHSFKEFKSNELFKEYKSSQELLQKYTNRAKRIKGQNEFQKNY